MRLTIVVGIMMLTLIALVSVISLNTVRVMQRVATVRVVEGEAFVHRAGRESKRIPLKQGMLVKTFDVIRTGKLGRVVLHWVDDFELEIKPNTVLRIMRSSFNKSTKATISLFFLRTGEAVARVQRPLTPRSRFELRTPIVTAAVRGTAFSVRVNEDKSVTVKVFEGVVRLTIKPTGAVVTLREGQRMRISSSGIYEKSAL
ncbi:MAG TPA: hypothetical protein EYP10_10680 [Armatimonadetes bacterium]|nr:hypothetical protein [Armatimonadota bacterium]